MRIITFLVGAVITALACLLSLKFVPPPLNIGVAIAAFVYLGIGGLIQIPIAFRGVPTVLGGRIGRWVLNEGWSWVLPRPLMAAEAIDVRERSTVVERFTVISKNRVRVTTDTTIQWKIDNPYRSLSVTETVIDQGLKDLVRQVLRSQIVNLSDEEALEAHETLRNTLETTADQKSADWGIDVTNVLIGGILLEAAVIEDYEKTKREERQRDAERIELRHVQERIEELRRMGFSLERAQEIVQTERGKVKKEVREQQITVSPETREAVKDIFISIFGRRP